MTVDSVVTAAGGIVIRYVRTGSWPPTMVETRFVPRRLKETRSGERRPDYLYNPRARIGKRPWLGGPEQRRVVRETYET